MTIYLFKKGYQNQFVNRVLKGIDFYSRKNVFDSVNINLSVKNTKIFHVILQDM